MFGGFDVAATGRARFEDEIYRLTNEVSNWLFVPLIQALCSTLPLINACIYVCMCVCVSVFQGLIRTSLCCWLHCCVLALFVWSTEMQ